MFNGLQVTKNENSDCVDWLKNIGMHELKSCGRYYSFVRFINGEHNVMSKIDQAFGNVNWM